MARADPEDPGRESAAGASGTELLSSSELLSTTSSFFGGGRACWEGVAYTDKIVADERKPLSTLLIQITSSLEHAMQHVQKGKGTGLA